MTTEVKRNTWTRFCKKFNATNQLRLATVTIAPRGGQPAAVYQNTPFLGLTFTRKGRAIDGVELFTSRFDPDRLAEPVVSVKQPARIILEKDQNGADSRLTVEAKDGTVASVLLTSVVFPEQVFVEKVAYSIYERRGHADGGHVDDWLEAERRVKQTELQFAR